MSSGCAPAFGTCASPIARASKLTSCLLRSRDAGSRSGAQSYLVLPSFEMAITSSSLPLDESQRNSNCTPLPLVEKIGGAKPMSAMRAIKMRA